MLLSQVLHKLIKFESIDFKKLDSETLSFIPLIKEVFQDFEIVGYAETEKKNYFYIKKECSNGDFVDLPISTDFLKSLKSAEESQKKKIKKVLKRERFDLFKIEVSKLSNVVAELRFSYYWDFLVVFEAFKNAVMI